MTTYIKDSHTTIFTDPTGCGKIHLVLDMIEKEYNKHFDCIIIICPTLRQSKIYHSRDWVKNDDKVWLIEPKDIIRRTFRCNKIVHEKVNGLYYWTEKLSQLLAHSETLRNTMISSPMKDLTRGGSPCQNWPSQVGIVVIILWLLTQSYSVIPKKLRRQAKSIFVWYPKSIQNDI